LGAGFQNARQDSFNELHDDLSIDDVLRVQAIVQSFGDLPRGKSQHVQDVAVAVALVLPEGPSLNLGSPGDCEEFSDVRIRGGDGLDGDPSEDKTVCLPAAALL
jgi:hypothetical protein